MSRARWSDAALAARLGRQKVKESSDRREAAGLPRRMLNPSFWIKSILALGFLRGRGLANALSPRLVGREEWFPSLPAAFDGFRILHISDLHLDLMPELAPVLRERLAGLSYDIIAATGDFRDSLLADGEAGVRLSAEILAGTGKPVYACLGNHDLASDVAILEAAGIAVLVNEGARIERGGEAIFLCGVDDPGYHRLDDFAAAFSEVPPGTFAVALSHDPCAYASAARAGAALMLSGHTHGGQIWPFHHLVRLQQPMNAGFAVLGDVRVFTSRGAGFWGPPLRLFAPSEVPILVLRKG